MEICLPTPRRGPWRLGKPPEGLREPTSNCLPNLLGVTWGETGLWEHCPPTMKEVEWDPMDIELCPPVHVRGPGGLERPFEGGGGATANCPPNLLGEIKRAKKRKRRKGHYSSKPAALYGMLVGGMRLDEYEPLGMRDADDGMMDDGLKDDEMYGDRYDMNGAKTELEKGLSW